jgi:hypothetical protein
MALDEARNLLYYADWIEGVVRRVNLTRSVSSRLSIASEILFIPVIRVYFIQCVNGSGWVDTIAGTGRVGTSYVFDFRVGVHVALNYTIPAPAGTSFSSLLPCIF